jgi:hypothetical protein
MAAFPLPHEVEEIFGCEPQPLDHVRNWCRRMEARGVLRVFLRRRAAASAAYHASVLV